MKKGLLPVLISLVLLTLCSCEKQRLQDDTTEQTTEASRTDTALSDDPIIAGYVDRLSQKRMDITDYKKTYLSEAETLKKSGSDKLSFGSCEFYPIDNVTSVSVLTFPEHNLTPQESRKIIMDWLKALKITGIDTDEQIRDASAQYKENKDLEYPFNYVAVAEHYPDFETGNGFFLNTNRCYIQMGNTGIYSMSDGTITRYLKLKTSAALDALGINSEDVVKTGSVAELGEKAWELPSGKVSVQDAADMTQKYFEKGTPYPPAENVSVYIPEVSVFRLGDKYGYTFQVRRKYQEIPLASANIGSHHYYDNSYSIEGDTKHAHVVTDKTVNGYTGHIEATEIQPAIQIQDHIIGLRNAVAMLDESLAPQIQVELDRVELVYCPISFEKSGEKKYCFPCWEFSGRNTTDQRGIKIYFDLLTGETYYYTYVEE